MIKLKETLNGWEKQKEWHGNPDLGYDSYKKTFVNPHNHRKTPVFVFGEPGDILYVVSAGAHSDFSYTGGFYPETPTFEEAMEKVDDLYEKGKLFK